ncbi:MAG: hypothetical protein V1799_14525 [bacterium]
MIFLLIIASFMISGTLIAQHNGDPLLFQGLTERNQVGVKGSAYGNAFTSRSNDLNALFSNAAGLADLQSIQISVSTHYRDFLTRDNQNFYPGSGYVGTSLYLEHLLIPDPAWNNIWDDSLRTIVYDSLGTPIGTNWWNADKLQWPVQGVDDYSKEATDHEQTFNRVAFDHIAIAVPFKFEGKHFVVAASYNRQYDVYDYDWNGSYLDPHWGSSDIIQAAPGSIVRSNWSVFSRRRTGGLYAFTGALAFQYDDHLLLGTKLNWVSGKSTDEQTLDRIGYFRFKHGENQSRWSFSYETNGQQINGTSEYRTSELSLGALYTSSTLNLGLNIQLLSTITRTWSYSTQLIDSSNVTTSIISGIDKVHMPAIYTAGITIKPNQGLIVSFAYEYNALSTAKYELSRGTPDSLPYYARWVDQISLRAGIEYSISSTVTILGGYQTRGAPFIGYGVAIRDAGAPMESYSCGISLSIVYGRFDVAYIVNRLKYYDVYMTNRNFTLEQSQRLSLGYTMSL